MKRIKVIKKHSKADITDKSLSVQTFTEYEMQTEWNRSLIVDALKKEARVEEKMANDIADSVEKKILKLEIEKISTDFIRSLVDEELTLRGETKKLIKQKLLGIPTYDLEQALLAKTQENSNVQANTPETINMYISETVLKQYALNKIFSPEVSEAHLRGQIHLHDLGLCTRVYCGSHSIELLKKYGLNLVNLSTSSLPPNRAHSLTGHLNTFLASMQTYWAGALGLAYLNTFYAPLLIELSEEQIKHEAQYLIFSLSQNAFSRGSQTLFIDVNIDLEVPEFLKQVPCIVKGGKYCTEFLPEKYYERDIVELRKNEDFRNCFWVFHKDKKKATKKDLIKHLENIGRNRLIKLVEDQEFKSRILTFGDFNEQAQKFAKAMMDTWYKGDATGKIFPFPKFQCHVNKQTFEDPIQSELFMYACELASAKGITNFVFDRDENGITLSQCCRLKETVTDMTMIESPETLRFTGFQNVSINLPQCSYRAKGDYEKTIKEIKKTMDLGIKAHLQKKKFIATLLDLPEKPLWQIGKKWPDGKPYVDLEKVTYILGIIGLNECVQHLTGKQLHETEEAYKLGLKIISNMYLYCKELAKEQKLKIVLEETPGESANPRLAKIDMMVFPESVKYIKGNQKSGDVYYTNSIHFAADAPIDIITRIEKQSKFAQLIEAGSITHIFLGEQQITKEAIYDLVKKTYFNTQCAQLTISPELVFCADCGYMHRGFYFMEEEE